MLKLIYPQFWHSRNFLSSLLIPLSYIYKLLGYLRYCFARPVRFPAKVICVGNATVGGTGKSQLVAMLMVELQKKAIKCVVLCKGYGGNFKQAKIVTSRDKAKQVGDEALMLSKYGTVIIAKNPKNALSIIQELKPDIIIVDDGMQSPYFYKDYIALCIDSMRGFGNERILPAGPMRMTTKAAMAMADICIIIGLQNDSIKNIKSGKKPIYSAETKIKCIANLNDEIKINPELKFFAFTGIGNPEKFYQSAKASGINICMSQNFPDHYLFKSHDIDKIKEVAAANNYDIVTTEKDFVKIDNHLLSGNIYYTKTDLVFANKNDIEEIINRIIKLNKC